MKSGRSIKVIEDLNLLIKNKTHMVNWTISKKSFNFSLS
jgi:hypothetical protein